MQRLIVEENNKLKADHGEGSGTENQLPWACSRASVGSSDTLHEAASLQS